MTKWLIPMLSLCLSGCFHWVDNGHSGVAERWPLMPEQRAGLSQTNSRLLLEGQFMLEKLSDEGATYIAPARLLRARALWVRAVREHSNGMDRAAHDNLLMLGSLLEGLQVQVQQHQPAAVTPHSGGIRL